MVGEDRKEEPSKEEQDKVETKELQSPEVKQTSRMVEDANLAAKRLEEANKTTKGLVERQEALAAQNALGGGSPAGKASAEKKEESNKEYRQRIEKEMAEGKHD